MPPPLSPQFINVGQAFLSESVLKCRAEGVLSILYSMLSIFKISREKPKKNSFTLLNSVLMQVRISKRDLGVVVSVYIVELVHKLKLHFEGLATHKANFFPA